jgi:alanine racemase-like protein
MAMRVDDRSAVQSGHAGSSVVQGWFAMACASLIALAFRPPLTISPVGPVMQSPPMWRPCLPPPILVYGWVRADEGETRVLVQDLDTPCAVVDLDIMENNLRRCQTYLDRHGLGLRPHIKTHKIPEFAHLQIRLGAKGVNCQKLGEAEVMVDAGIADILLTYNLIGQAKLDRLVALARRSDIKAVADSNEVIEGLSSAMSRAGLELPVLVECDTGAQRCGVTSPVPSRWRRQLIARQGSLSAAL